MIRFENVGLRYGMGPEILRDITFQIAERSFQFLSGPSGAGKTTLLRLMFMSLKPTRGLITIFGKDALAHRQDALHAAAAPHRRGVPGFPPARPPDHL